jgi:cellulose synthase/poly-beta-1,6-N-acetylglucosamine synthase-like glycosyltransferase
VKTFLIILWRFVKALPLVLLFPILMAIAMAALALVDLASALRKKVVPSDKRPNTASASVVIPNWNGRDLLQKYFPSIVEAVRGNSDNEIIVVDNGSEDGTAEFLREHFPSVRVLALERHRGSAEQRHARGA